MSEIHWLAQACSLSQVKLHGSDSKLASRLQTFCFSSTVSPTYNVNSGAYHHRAQRVWMKKMGKADSVYSAWSLVQRYSVYRMDGVAPLQLPVTEQEQEPTRKPVISLTQIVLTHQR